MELLTKKQVDELLAGGGYLGDSPKFEVGDKVRYRLASYDEVGYFAEPPGFGAPKADRTLEVLGIRRQVQLGLPSLDLVWEYEVVALPIAALSKYFVLLEPQLEANG